MKLRGTLLLFLVTGLSLILARSYAATCTFSGTGNFSNAALWDFVPNANDSILIKGTCTFDNAASNLAYGNVSIGDGNTNGILLWPVGGTNTFNVKNLYSNSNTGYTGTVNMTNGGILQIRGTWTSTRLNLTAVSSGTAKIIMASNSNMTIPAAYTTFNNLTIAANVGVSVSLGAAITVFGDFTLTSGTFAPNNNVSLKKGWIYNAGTFTPGIYTVTFNGSSAQSISGTLPTTFYNLTLSNASGLSTSTNTTINNILTLTTGVLSTGSGVSVIIPLGGSVSRISGFVSGNLKKWISNTSTKIFEVGSGANYSPAEVTFNAITTAGYLTITTTSGDYPSLCSPLTSIDGEQSINRYWTLVGGGVAPSNFKIKLTYVSGDLDTPTPSAATRAIYTNSGGITWSTSGGTYTRTGTSTELSGFTSFGDFIVGTPYSSPTIAYQMGPTDSTNVGIATSFTLAANGSYPHYQWQKNGINLSDGGAFSGVTTATLMVTPTSVGDAGDYRCIITGTCGDYVTSVTVALSVFNTYEFLATSGNWGTGASWSTGVVPSSSDTVYIPSGKTVSITGVTAATCKSLTLKGTLDITGDATLTGSPSGKLLSTSGSILQIEKNFPTDFGDFDIAGTTEFYGPSPQYIPQVILGETILSGAGLKMMAGNLIANSLTIESGASLDIMDDSHVVQIFGNWVNNGTFEPRNGTVEFLRLGLHNINGTTETRFNNITVGVQADVKLVSNASVFNTLQLVDSSTFNTNGKILTLLSESATHSARIAQIPTNCSFSGTILQQRYMQWQPPAAGTSYNWHTIGFALVGSGFSGITYNESAAGNINYGYSDSIAPYTNVNIPGLMEGVYTMIYEGNDTLVEATGSPITGTYTKYLSYTDNGLPTADGWNLLCNPYPSAIDLRSDSIVFHGTSETFYMWNASTNDYNFFNKQSGGNGSGILAPGQAFWLQASSNQDNVYFNEDAKTDASAEFIRSTGVLVEGTHVLELTVSDLTNNNDYRDQTFIRFGSDFSINFEKDNDSYRLLSGNSAIPNLSTLSADQQRLALNSLPELTGNTSVPVFLLVKTTGQYSIQASNIGSFPSSTCMVLEDLENGTFFDLRSNSAYTFIASTTASPVNRFVLHFSAPAVFQTTDASCHGTPDGKATVQGTGNGPWTYTWYNEAGQIIRNTTCSGADSSNTLTAGHYTVSITNSGGTFCNNVSLDMQIGSLPQILIDASVTNPICSDGGNGSITLSAIGGAQPFTYLWNNQETGSSLHNLTSGNYVVTITDANNCTENTSIPVSAEYPISATFATASNEYVIGNNPSILVAFVNSTIGADSYTWDFGDGSPILTSSLQNMAHSYHAAGTYLVTLTANNSFCNSSMTLPVEVKTVSGIVGHQAENTLVYTSNKQLFIKSSEGTNKLQVAISNTLGQELYKQDFMGASKEIVQIDLQALPTGVYFVTCSDGLHVQTDKITLHNDR